tara:strand:+ start:923 stop:1138 length:216 start_codon:yes stop_codon:yes gene_type:complete
MNRHEAFAIEINIEEARKCRREIISRANCISTGVDVDDDGVSHQDKFMQSINQLENNLDAIWDMVLVWHKK